MENRIWFFAVLFVAVIICSILKLFFLKKKQISGNYAGNNKLVPWVYSEQQGGWVSPEKPLPQSRMNGNTYLGDEEMDTTWENFNKKD